MATETKASKPPVPAAPDAWLDEYFNHLATFLSQPSLQSYSRALLGFWHWYEKERKEAPDWRNLQRHDFRAYLHSPDLRKKSHATVRLQFAALRSFYRFLVDRGRLESSPVKGVKIPQLPKRLVKYFSTPEIETLMAAPSKPLPKNARAFETLFCSRDIAMFETMYSCGLRISELCGLRAKDIGVERRLVFVRGKGKRQREIPIGEPALDAILHYWRLLPRRPAGDTSAFLARRKRDVGVSPRVFQQRLQKWIKKAGMEEGLTPHKLRHSYATHLVDCDADLRSVQELLGHAHLATTEIYTHVATGRLMQVYKRAHPRA